MSELLDRRVTGFDLFPNRGPGGASVSDCEILGIGGDLVSEEEGILLAYQHT